MTGGIFLIDVRQLCRLTPEAEMGTSLSHPLGADLQRSLSTAIGFWVASKWCRSPALLPLLWLILDDFV
jgi:hypothetical protein